ncbi:uncharacterized protein At3g49140 isoform X1 [Vigna umbellata]|uniref:uncharacterized protein At3g49140 isoform X1 n=2 Tax=Vigna umbellata TaxID=87088 RepID=UPI001F5E8FF3|nr:uncharacterized protein At3g49140 isoform X1 [Vigna umbellata]XP_047181750.1 uncharacterized protein At3g49140 isoform X2 [Vigna umbellata]XP_047181751.1 uncharacterized protein At3g49140 isoform X1 [Vigna umbellata]XP_047181752.1 uncharacterized protein At3g49140 isoform X1 [Vigna umbellata]
MAIRPPASSSLSSPSEGICYSTSYGITSNSIKLPIDGRRWHDLASTRYKSSCFGLPHLLWPSTGHDQCLSKVNVAADYSDSIPDSSDHMDGQGYHPLEELKGSEDVKPARLSPPEMAKTTVEANKNALLVFPGMVHCEPHEQISWAEFQYHIDDFGDIYFEIFDDANILADRGANNPVKVFIGMDIPIYDNNRRTANEYDIFNNGKDDELFTFDNEDDVVEVSEMEEFNISVNWGHPDSTNSIHPIYFSKCLTKAVNNLEYIKRMNHPTNGVSIIGFLRPIYDEERSYLRWMYHTEDGAVYISGLRDSYSNSIDDQGNGNSTLYGLEILKIKLYSMYGNQSEISVLEFQDAEPDILAHSSSEILERFNRFCDDDLKALCKKKGLDAEGAYLVGVDSLGMDVRVFSGVEVKTHRFPFKIQAATINAAAKQIWQLLFPRSQRKKNMKKWRTTTMI